MTDTRTFRVVDEDGDYYEITGDPMDALNAAYRERAHLVALLAAEHPSHIGHTDPESPNWAVVTIELPTGQACWHVASDDMDLFEHVRPTSADDPGWDGHTTVEKYGRVDEMATQVAAARASGEQPQDERDAELAAFIAERNAAHEAAAEADKQRAECRREAALLRARVRELEAAQGGRDGDVRALRAFLTHFREDPDDGVLDEVSGDALTIGLLRRTVAALDARDAKAGERR